jgi:transposase-like protein
MSRRSSLSDAERQVAVALFEAGQGRRAVATHLGASRDAVRELHDRWRIWGGAALETKPTKRVIPFEVKRDIVLRFLAGEEKVALAQEYALSSARLIGVWVRAYRADGENGLRPKPKGRPKRDPQAPVREESELDRLRHENERLRAEVAYLGKLQALMSRERR